MVKALFDTNILVDYLNAVPEARTEFKRYTEKAISIVTWMEVMAGAADEAERQALRQFLCAFERAELSEVVMERAARLRSETRLRLPDAIILATALCASLMLITRNTKDFDTAVWPNIRVPYRV